MTQSVVTIFYGGCSMQGLVQIFFELTSFSSSVFCFFLTVELVSLEENISFIRSFCCHLVKKRRSVQSPLFLDTYPGGSPSSRVKITRDMCWAAGRGDWGPSLQLRANERAFASHSRTYGQFADIPIYSSFRLP